MEELKKLSYGDLFAVKRLSAVGLRLNASRMRRKEKAALMVEQDAATKIRETRNYQSVFGLGMLQPQKFKTKSVNCRQAWVHGLAWLLGMSGNSVGVLLVFL